MDPINRIEKMRETIRNSTLADLDFLQREIRELRFALNEASGEIRDLCETLKEADEEVHNLQTDLMSASIEINNLQDQLNQSQKELEALQERAFREVLIAAAHGPVDNAPSLGDYVGPVWGQEEDGNP